MSPEPLWDVKQVAARLGVPTSWIYEQAERHGLPVIRIGRYRRFDPTEVEAWIANQRTRTPIQVRA
jgi:excisionase family DNA binding protein